MIEPLLLEARLWAIVKRAKLDCTWEATKILIALSQDFARDPEIGDALMKRDLEQ